MKMKCVSRCQFKGDIVRIGEEVEIDETSLKNDPVAKSAFVPVDPAAVKKQPESAPIVAGLTRKQVLLKLASAKIPCDDTMSNDELAKRFNEAFDTKKAHATKA